MTSSSSTELLGARLLGEIKSEESTLEELLSSIRTTLLPPPSVTGIPHLDGLIERYHGTSSSKSATKIPKLSVAGRGLPLLYHIVSTLVITRNGTVAVVDLDGRFSPSHLRCDLDHVYIFRPPVIGAAASSTGSSGDEAGRSGQGGNGTSASRDLKRILEGVERFMLYGDHGSRAREWVGTVVSGGSGGDICAVWNGWLSVDREEVVRFPAGISVDDAMTERERRQEIVDGSVWKGRSRVGWYAWKEE
ncbi:hypothetical protein F5884DRAFT_292720 [Xylogone sp. PMI_703]|nr:hypothetical protein F5884DRAFT_292720 [Xylogone sp. PMI_703]